MFFLIVGTCGIIYLCSLIWMRMKWFEKAKINHWKPIFIIGNLMDFILRRKHVGDLAQGLYESFPNDRFVGFFFFTKPIILLRDPKLIHDIGTTQFDHFPDRLTSVPEEGDSYIGGALPSIKGLKWREMRSILNPAFSQTKMSRMAPYLSRHSDLMVDYLKSKFIADGSDTLDIHCDFLLRYLTNVYAEISFGLDMNAFREDGEAFHKIASDMIDNFAYENAEDIIEDELTAIKRKEMVYVTKSVIRDQSLNFIVAGVNTTGASLTFFFNEMAENPECQTKLFREIDAMWKQCGSEINAEQLRSMKYLDMAVAEVVRKWPPTLGAIDRVCDKDFDIGPAMEGASERYTMSAGETVWFSILALHRDAKYWSNPMKFDPERFSAENKSKIVPHTYIPFGLGPRRCIGMVFAILSMKMVIYFLLSQFEFVPSSKDTEKQRYDPNSVTLAPRNKWLAIKRR